MKQVTDTIHDTIYLSELESELISTPYFYRLHDIYQSSTVYMTFPVLREIAERKRPELLILLCSRAFCFFNPRTALKNSI